MSALRWLEASFSLPTSFMRWPRLFAAYFSSTPLWSSSRSSDSLAAPRRWSARGLLEALDVSIVDNLLWPLISAVESVALVSMLGFFFLFCGCTI